ncbi:biosynthetic-type acetolactate synthase large subunit [Aurantivibrio infirmus]
MKISGAQIVIKLLEREGITKIPGIPGGAILPLYDALVDSHIEHVLARHEQGAGFIAQGIARVSGQAAVCMASSGPGATNLITAVADAKMDSIPLVVITAQVPQELIGTDAFQEADTFGLMLPITKHNFLVRSAAELLEVIPESFRLACEGRPGPVSIDIPKDVLMEVIEIKRLPEITRNQLSKIKPPPHQVEAIYSMIKDSKQPVLMIGGGVIHASCSRQILCFAEKENIPIVASFMGLGAVPDSHPLFLGMLGMHAAPYTNLILEECDLLIGAGVRFDDRATGRVDAFCPNAKVIHIDIDESELGKIKKASLAIRADIGETMSALVEKYSSPIDCTDSNKLRTPWLERVKTLKEDYPLDKNSDSSSAVEDLFTPYGLLEFLSKNIDENATIVTDVGQHQMWTAQAFPFNRPRQWISSGGLGTMGFGLPAAIGAAMVQPERQVVCITGDGSIMMNIQELDTAAEHGLNIKIIVMNNENLGLVRQQQNLFYGGRITATQNRRQLNFAKLAEAMGVKGLDLGMSQDPQRLLLEALQKPGCHLINVPIEEDVKVFPMVPPGAANKDMIGVSS